MFHSQIKGKHPINIKIHKSTEDNISDKPAQKNQDISDQLNNTAQPTCCYCGVET